jgi:hypothetical protein
MDKQEISPQALIAAYREARVRDPQAQIAILRGANLAGQDLSGFDLSGADLSHADLSHCILRETNLSEAVTEGTLFSGILVGDLLASGLTPAAILATRYQANKQLSQANPPRKWVELIFTPETAMEEPSGGSLGAIECQQVCDSLSSVGWEDLSDGPIFQVLYPGVPWCERMEPFVLAGKRAILNWMAHHWKTLEEFFEITKLDEWAIAFNIIDLSDGIATDPWQVARQVAWQKALNEESPVKQYPTSPWGNAPEITQIRSSAEAWYEEILLPSLDYIYDFKDYASYLERGVLFLYHIGPPLPDGSTALLSLSGRLWNHKTSAGKVTQREQQLLNEWLTTFGMGGKAYRWTSHLPREVLSKQQILQELRQTGIMRVIWNIDWFVDNTQCTVLTCYTEEGKQVPLPQPLDDVDFWCLTQDELGKWYYSGTFELSVQQESVRALDAFPDLSGNRWTWTE